MYLYYVLYYTLVLPIPVLIHTTTQLSSPVLPRLFPPSTSTSTSTSYFQPIPKPPCNNSTRLLSLSLFLSLRPHFPPTLNLTAATSSPNDFVPIFYRPPIQHSHSFSWHRQDPYRSLAHRTSPTVPRPLATNVQNTRQSAHSPISIAESDIPYILHDSRCPTKGTQPRAHEKRDFTTSLWSDSRLPIPITEYPTTTTTTTTTTTHWCRPVVDDRNRPACASQGSPR